MNSVRPTVHLERYLQHTDEEKKMETSQGEVNHSKGLARLAN